jgi:hypothetical protein
VFEKREGRKEIAFSTLYNVIFIFQSFIVRQSINKFDVKLENLKIKKKCEIVRVWDFKNEVEIRIDPKIVKFKALENVIKNNTT